MTYNPRIHQRRSMRLSEWDYSWAWWYYVTIVLRDRRCLLGDVENNAAVLSNLGVLVDACWKQIPQHHKHVELDDYVIMPNHIHGIVIINDDRRDVQLNVPTTVNSGATKTALKNERMSSISQAKWSLSVVIRTFKAAVTTMARDTGFVDFVWQPRFYDHIIRNDADLHRIRTYIANNPLQWSLDEENPENRR